LKTGQIDAVADYGNLARIVSLSDQPVSDRASIDENAVGEPTDEALQCHLLRGEVDTLVANGRDDDRRPGQPGGRNGEYVAVEVIGMHDLDVMTGDVARQSDLLKEAFETREPRNGILAKRDTTLLDFRQEVPPPSHAREAKIEATRIQCQAKVDELPL